MPIRLFTLSTILLAAIVPALSQDAARPFAPSQIRATGATYPAAQDRSQWLGSNLIGAKVISASGETIGRIANLVINEDGAIESVVIAVGGVLGVGAKDVAVTYRSLVIIRSRAGDGIDHVTLAASKNDLRIAAEYKTLRQQTAERKPAP